MITVATDGVTDVADGLRAFPALPMPQIVSEAHDLRKFTIAPDLRVVYPSTTSQTPQPPRG